MLLAAVVTWWRHPYWKLQSLVWEEELQSKGNPANAFKSQRKWEVLNDLLYLQENVPAGLGAIPIGKFWAD